MNDESKAVRIRLFIGYCVCIAIGVALVLLVMDNYGYADAETEAERYRILCDAFTIPGVTLMLSAGLVAMYNQGVFTGVTYALRRTKDILLPFLKTEYIKYPEYKRRKEQKKVRHYSFLLITGASSPFPRCIS